MSLFVMIVSLSYRVRNLPRLAGAFDPWIALWQLRHARATRRLFTPALGCPVRLRAVRRGVARLAIEPARRAVDRARMPRPVVAVLAEVGRGLVEELGVHRAVRVVAGRAVLLDRRVVEHVRAALVGVAAVALVVDGRLLQHRRRDRAVRVVAVAALDLAFDDRVMRRLDRRGPDRLVAVGADVRLVRQERGHELVDRRARATCRGCCGSCCTSLR